MKTRNILERRIDESYNRYKKLYREQQDKGFSLEKMFSKKEYSSIYKDNIGLGRKNIARDLVYDQRLFIKGEEQLEKAVEDLSSESEAVQRMTEVSGCCRHLDSDS